MAPHDIKFEIEGLITILAQNLYADPDVFLREMIQNAHDSIVKRALSNNAAEFRVADGRIEIVPGTDSLRILDNGAGLTESEIHKFLSTVGRSGTRELKEQLRGSDRAQAVDLIGQFGIGLLSAFVVAERVEILTRAEGEPALLWTSRGGKHYELVPAERETVGTEVTLHLQRHHKRYLAPERLRDIVRRYADFVGIPIFIGAETTPVNTVNAPWHRTLTDPRAKLAAYREYWERRFEGETAIDLLPIDETVTVPAPRQPGVDMEGHVRGVIGIQTRGASDANAAGLVDVYVARMFIAQGHRDLLPTWGRFLQGVIECDVLTPNAARDDVVKNSALTAVREALSARILAWLTDLATKEPQRFAEVMRSHASQVLAIAVRDEHQALFRAVADLLPLESDRGPLAMRDYLASAPVTDGKKTVFYLTEPGATTQFYVLCRERGIRVFNAAERSAETFLDRYAATWPDRIRLVRVDVAGSDVIFTKLDDSDPDRERYLTLEAEYLRLFSDLRCIAKVSRFRPASVPAVLTENRQQRTRRELEEAAQSPTLPASLRGLMDNLLHDKREPLRLHLNADNPAIQSLARRDTLRDPVAQNALVSLYNNAHMLLSRALMPQDVERMFGQSNAVIEQLLRLSDENASLLREKAALEARVREIDAPPASRALAECHTCFVAMPYDVGLDPVFAALKEALGDMPYVWDVIRADSEARSSTRAENLRRHIESAHCFIVEISAANPNVMIELGQMMATDKPLLLLREKQAISFPQNLLGDLYVEYSRKDPDLVGQLREQIKKHPRFTKTQGKRKLTETVLRRATKGEIVEKVLCSIARQYATCDEFLDVQTADIPDAAKRLESGPGTFADAQAYLREYLQQAHRG